jgi:MFS family permease
MLIRRYGWSQAKTGQVFGIIVAIAGTLGIVSGGHLADWLRPRGYADANLRVALWSAIAGVPFILLFPLAPSANLVAGLLMPVVFFMSMPFGVAPAAIQQMMPNTMRAQATAFYLFVINLLGIGVGPWIVAVPRPPRITQLDLVVSFGPKVADIRVRAQCRVRPNVETLRQVRRPVVARRAISPLAR